MAIIKSYSDLSQSKKLAEILPLESADMHYVLIDTDEDKYASGLGKYIGILPHYPCWSLAALLDVLPNRLQIVLAINDFQGDRKEKYVIGSVEHDNYDCYADNPVDACVTMVEKLHKLNLL